ncbi:hypothetical protein KKC88_00350 [Patescibacteria group bacterium]|nr:hypothetical protein [Patescibacteria group bacterium]MBU1672915.1 hypothetical protein [Patescibacteria group bacterium]MBU1963386.1 hypothetical protein [Patescibacteria group bacterium]
MSKFLLFSKHNRKKVNKPKSNGKLARIFNNRTSFSIIIIVTVVFIGATYISVVNATADKGFDVDAKQNYLEALKKENRKLELEVAEAQSMQNIKRASEGMELEKITEAEYMPSSAGFALGE